MDRSEFTIQWRDYGKYKGKYEVRYHWESACGTFQSKQCGFFHTKDDAEEYISEEIAKPTTMDPQHRMGYPTTDSRR